MDYGVDDFICQAKKELEIYIDFYNMYCSLFADEIAAYAYYLIFYSDLRKENFFYWVRNKLSRFTLDIITLFALTDKCVNSDQVYEPKPFQYIRDYNGLTKIISKENPPSKGIERNTENFKSYDKKLYNSISRARQAVYELAICNDWKYFATFTIDKKRYDRYNLKEYITAFTKWLSNYSARKTGGIKIDYVLIPELNKDGAWHLHGLMNGIPSEHLLLFEQGKHPRRLVKNGFLNWNAYEEKFGFCSLDKIRSKEKVAAYITKYIRKPSIAQKRELHSKLYYCTQGLKRSTEICRGYNLISIDKYDFENEHVGIKWLDDKCKI